MKEGKTINITKGINVCVCSNSNSTSNMRNQAKRENYRFEDSIMKEYNKYYTPAIEEFHIGFIYYTFSPEDIRNDDYSDGANIIITAFDQFTTDIEYGLEKGIIRVKYLDEEDILSLDFTYYANSWGETKIFRHNKGIELEITGDSIKRVIIKNVYSRTLFEGNVRNKSELIRILKMIGI